MFDFIDFISYNKFKKPFRSIVIHFQHIIIMKLLT